jgi:hypothetical protein
MEELNEQEIREEAERMAQREAERVHHEMVKLAVPEPQSSMHIKERMKASKGGMSLSCCVLPSGFFPCHNSHPQCF